MQEMEHLHNQAKEAYKLSKLGSDKAQAEIEEDWEQREVGRVGGSSMA
jgi:hypothetical protein